MIGTKLAHYEITERIGEGGMGVVWKANDTTLHRSVAIKVLPEVLARDPERLARLEREARLLAALSHPNIASIYGLHEDHGVRFLAMELAPGENLAERISRGALPQDEALAIALKIAEALEHAHEHGIVHRDLKPANVVIGAEGGVKVLDFGLAKAFDTEPAGGSSPSLTQSPTITAGMTAANVVLGTAAYMSPEQARGHAADKRADIWAFGVVLYEMLTGARMFEGDTVSDVLAAVLRAEFDWARLPGGISPRVRVLLERCLMRDRRARLRDIGEARFMLAAEISGAPDPYSGAGDPRIGGAGPHASRVGAWAWPVGIGAVALLVGLLAGRGLPRETALGVDAIPHRQLKLRTATGVDLPQISPDGRRVAWLEADTLLVQELDSTDPRRIPLPARTRPSDLFWAPDGNELGYLSGSTVHAIDLRTRESRQICDVRVPFSSGSGATWDDDGIITITRADRDGLLQVPAVGGDPHVVLPSDSLISDYHDPCALPGRRGVLYLAHTATGTYDEIHVFDGQVSRRLLRVEGHLLFDPVFSPSGHILYQRNQPSAGIWAVPFSLAKLEITGEPFLVAPESDLPSVARDGTLLFLHGQSDAQSDLLLANGDGTVRSTIMRFAAAGAVVPAMSPDGRRVVVPVQDADGSDLWVCDIERGTRTRLTFTGRSTSSPVWTPDGRAIVYQARLVSSSGWTLFLQAADGSGEPDTLVRGAYLPGVTPDGRSILYTRQEDGAVCLQSLEGGEATPTGLTGFAKPAVSPDGRYVAYVSDETGRNEVYLRRFPSFSGKWQVSTAGGDWPIWNARGDRIYFASDNDVMVVDVEAADAAVLGVPRLLFTRPQMSVRGIAGWSARFGVNADGTLFVFGADVGPGVLQASLVLDQNWFAPFAQRAR